MTLEPEPAPRPSSPEIRNGALEPRNDAALDPLIRRALLRGLVLAALFAPVHVGVTAAILVARGLAADLDRDWAVITLAAGAAAGFVGLPLSIVELLASRIRARPGRDVVAALVAGVAAFVGVGLAFFAADYVESRIALGISPRGSIFYLGELYGWMAVRPSDYAPILALAASPLAVVVAARLAGLSWREQTGVALLALVVLVLVGALAVNSAVIAEQGGPLVTRFSWSLMGALLLAPLAPAAFELGEALDEKIERALGGEPQGPHRPSSP